MATTLIQNAQAFVTEKCKLGYQTLDGGII